jgi:hypothetical protein
MGRELRDLTPASLENESETILGLEARGPLLKRMPKLAMP